MQARLQQINEEWKRLEEARERRERLDRRIDDLRAQRRERKEKEQECAGILAKERADVEALEKRGLKSFLAALSGEKEERLSRERREELEAAVRYDQARRDLEYIDDQLRALLGQRETLEDPAGELERLRKEKEALLRGMGGAVGAQLSGLDGSLRPCSAGCGRWTRPFPQGSRQAAPCPSCARSWTMPRAWAPGICWAEDCL